MGILYAYANPRGGGGLLSGDPGIYLDPGTPGEQTGTGAPAGAASAVAAAGKRGVQNTEVEATDDLVALAAVIAGVGSITATQEIVGIDAPVVAQIAAISGAGIVVEELYVPRVSINLVNESGVAQSSLSGLKWAWFDEVTPDLLGPPTDQGSAELTDGSGVLTIDLPRSSKTLGQVGWLVVTNSDGTPTQNPSHRAFSGPVAVQ
jgi:hypothetical protein